MRTKIYLWRILYLSIIPVLGLLAVHALLAYRRNALATQLPGIDEQGLLSLATGRRCRLIDQLIPGIPDSCITFAQAQFASVVSAAALLLSAALVAGIWLASIYARNDRLRLAKVFGPAAWLTMVALACLILLQAIALAAVLYVVGNYFAWFNPAWAVMIIAAGLFIAGRMILKGFAIARPEPLDVLAKEVSPDEQPDLWGAVRDIAAKLGARPPDHVICGISPSFYAVALPIRPSEARTPITGETLHLSLPLMRMLSISELAAVIGHELSHFKGEDLAYSVRFVSSYARVSAAMERLEESTHVTAITAIPAMIIFGLLIEWFLSGEGIHSQERELKADRGSVTAAGTEAAASALVRTGVLSNLWAPLVQEFRSLHDDKPNISVFLADRATELLASTPLVDVLAAIRDEQPAHPTDSHPSTAERLRHLGVQVEAAAAMLTPPGPAAISLLHANADLEQQLTTRLKGRFSHYARMSDFVRYKL